MSTLQAAALSFFVASILWGSVLMLVVNQRRQRAYLDFLQRRSPKPETPEASKPEPLRTVRRAIQDRGACGVRGCRNLRPHSHVEDLARRLREDK